jgi:integrase
MARMKLTKRVVESTQPRQGVLEVVVMDTDVRGFGLRVQRTAKGHSRAYIVCWPSGKQGRPRQLSIGHHGSPWRPDPVTGAARQLTVELAREEATRILGARVDGGDPRAARAAAGGIPTLKEFEERYFADWQKAPASVVKDKGNLELHIRPALGARRLDQIGEGDVTRLMRDLRGTPTTANRCRSLLSHMFTMAKRWDVLPRSHPNPCSDVQRYHEEGRERFLSPAELPKVGAALVAEAEASPHAVAAILIVMFTGARPVEILGLRREELGGVFRDGVLMRASRKTKAKRRPLYFNPAAAAVLDALWPRPWPKHGPEWVFTGGVRGHGKHLTIWGANDAWERVRNAAGCPDVHLYDLRHTFLSVGARRRVGAKMLQGLAGHASGKMTERYLHLADAPLMEASTEVSEEIAAALKGEIAALKG